MGTTSRRTGALSFWMVGVALVIGLGLAAPDPVEGVPPGDATCVTVPPVGNTIHLNGGAPRAPIPGAQVRIQGPQNAVVHFSADVGVPEDAEVRLSFSIDGTPHAEFAFGPGNLANAAQFAEARALMNVIPVGPGAHTIQALWRVNGGPDKTATMFGRCLAVGTNIR